MKIHRQNIMAVQHRDRPAAEGEGWGFSTINQGRENAEYVADFSSPRCVVDSRFSGGGCDVSTFRKCRGRVPSEAATSFRETTPVRRDGIDGGHRRFQK